jgi:hypothetical protein
VQEPTSPDIMYGRQMPAHRVKGKIPTTKLPVISKVF